MDFDDATERHARSILAVILRKRQEPIKILIDSAIQFLNKRELENALVEVSKAIQLSPTAAELYSLRSFINKQRGDAESALKDDQMVLRLDPKDNYTYNAMAWNLATNIDPKMRDGLKAIQYATMACELSLWEDYNELDTLAAAYAEAGKYDDAVKWQSKAIEMLPKDNIEKDKGYKQRLSLYEAHKPYRDDSKK